MRTFSRLCSNIQKQSFTLQTKGNVSVMCVFFPRDEDMQSLASLMSMKQSDIGNLDDFNDSDDEDGEERRASFGTGQTTHATGNIG